MDLLSLGKNPISEAKPAGDDARYEPEYDELQQQIDRLTSVTAGGPIDWKQVVNLSSVLLASKSKDIKVASYLGVALLNLKGVDGLSASAQVLLDLVSGYWDTMYPNKKRMHGRFSAISWWSDNVEKYLSSYEGEDLPKSTVDLLAKRFSDLDAALSEKADDAPMLRSLADYANRLPVQAIVEEVSENSTGPSGEGEQILQEHTDTPAAQDGSYAPGSTSFGSISSSDDCQRALDAGLYGLSAVADYLLANDLSNMVGYRLRRLVAWTPILSLPPSEKGLTMIPPPDSSVKGSITNQLETGAFAGAVQAAESRVGEYLFWLDLSHLTVMAFGGLGEKYSDAKLAVELEVSLLVKRLPGIDSMTFSDGTPFADTKTKAWLKSLNKEKNSSIGVGADKNSVAEKVFAEATKLAKNKKIFDSVSIIQDTLNSRSSAREQFLLRLGMVSLLTDVEQNELAHAHVEVVLEHIKIFRLEEWEPNLALSGYKSAYDALIAEGGDVAVALSKETLKRIGRINPAEALKITGLN